jgi:osmotically-inducible protein OsmY
VTIQDEALAGMVRNALVQDKRIGGQAIAVRVAEGEVFLKGIVDAEEMKDLAALVARGIPGVRYVIVDELRVREVAG